MTEYGRGYGSEPWHPEDPLYGDQGSYGGQAQQPQWGGQQQSAPQQSAPQQYRGPQQQHPQQQYNGGWEGSHGGHPSGGGQAPYDAYEPYDPYGQQPPADPYAAPDQHQQHYDQQAAYPQQAPPYQQHYPPQQYDQRPSEPHYGDGAGAGVGVGDDWRAEPELPREPEPDHPFFTDAPDGPYDDDRDGRDRRDAYDDPEEYDDDPDDGRRSGRDRRGKNKKGKRRSRTTCLVVTLFFAGAVGAVGYFGWDFVMAHFGAAPDYEGEGSGDVQVEIPDGSPLSEMGQILAKNGVIKSADAFNEAADENQKAKTLPPGTYTLHKEMSAASAIDLMLDPKSRNGLTIREGLRAGAVYALIDKKLHLQAGTTKSASKKELKNLGLPSWANDSKNIKDPLEGFLFPSTYSVGEHAKPVDVLKQMVGRATAAYGKVDLEAAAQKFHLKSPLQVITVASLTQAEGMTHDDFKKMAAVVYNRLAPTNTDTNQKLQFDSTYNYLKNQSKINISLDEINNYDDPYNTYFYRGLPPGPIGNPGIEALQATVSPDTSKRWLYFVSIDDKKTQFATNLTEHNKLVEERKKWQAEHKGNGN
ncbi:endolytic transglycosylase MltG [Streptomyces sp. NPDC048506]|uniref:endolytic transglycosylase MltG n=1 Tax=Streptomyces sp. NPDC048506 TaxID=3155028 RepID=UPI00343E214F